MALDVSALNDFNNEVAGKVYQRLYLKDILLQYYQSKKVSNTKSL